MRQFRLVLVALLVIAASTQRFRGMLLGLTIIAVNELVYQLLNLQGQRGKRPPRRWPQWARLLWRRRPRWLRSPVWLRRPEWLRWPGWLRPYVWTRSTGFGTYERIVGEISWARYSRRDFDLGLRKRLLEAATVRLAEGHGVDIERDAEAGRRLLGSDVWALLGPGRLPSDNRDAAGVDLREIDHMVTAIERLNSAAGSGPAGPGGSSARDRHDRDRHDRDWDRPAHLSGGTR
jgi:hypothetical protein